MKPRPRTKSRTERDAAATWWKEAGRRNFEEEPSLGNSGETSSSIEKSFSAKAVISWHHWYNLSARGTPTRVKF